MNKCDWPVGNVKDLRCEKPTWSDERYCYAHGKYATKLMGPAPKCGCGNPTCGHLER